jgi:hypothetical protein
VIPAPAGITNEEFIRRLRRLTQIFPLRGLSAAEGGSTQINLRNLRNLRIKFLILASGFPPSRE